MWFAKTIKHDRNIVVLADIIFTVSHTHMPSMTEVWRQVYPLRRPSWQTGCGEVFQPGKWLIYMSVCRKQTTMSILTASIFIHTFVLHMLCRSRGLLVNRSPIPRGDHFSVSSDIRSFSNILVDLMHIYFNLFKIYTIAFLVNYCIFSAVSVVRLIYFTILLECETEWCWILIDLLRDN